MSQVIEFKRFSCTKLGANANKYWNVTLYDNDDVMSEWGRQGKTSQSKTWNGVGRSFMEKKIAEKDKNGYHENQTVEGSGDIAVSARAVANTQLKDIATKQIKSKNPIVAKLVDFLVKCNAHQILQATGGKIKFDTSSATFKTTQGVVIPAQVSQARDLLDNLARYVKAGDFSSYRMEDDLNEYLSLIPRDFGMGRMAPQDIVEDMSDIQKENDILDGLDASFAGLQTAKPKAKKTTKKKAVPSIFDVSMEIVEDKKVISHVKHLYQSTRKSMHSSNNLSVQTVYAVSIAPMKTAYDKRGSKMSNIMQLWHGTKASNLLSILRQGLVIPPSSSSHCTGRMFSNGVYFSDISTKALNYATNFWGSGGKVDRTFMFLADVAMGKMYIPTSWSSGPFPKSGYDSTFAQSGKSGVHNNEMIVYNLNQCNVVYLVEFVPRNQYRG